MRNILLLTVLMLAGLTATSNLYAEDFPGDYLGSASSGLTYIPGKGYSWPSMGSPVTRYYYDPSGGTHLVEVDPFTLEVRRSPVDLSKPYGKR